MGDECIVNEEFVGDNISDLLKWRCEPQSWFLDKESSQLVFTSDDRTDYWQNTHYGFRADNFRMATKVKALSKSNKR